MSWLTTYGHRRAKNKRLIQMAMDNAGLSQATVAQRAGVTHQTVSATLNGFCHSPKVLDVLRQCGVEEKFLFDPHKQKTA